MSYQIKILLLSFIASVVVSLVIIPILRRLKVGQIERTEGPESHLKKQGTPTMGGIVMIITILAVSVFMYLQYIKTEAEVAKNLIPLVLVTIGFGIVGFVDDFKKLVLKNTDGLKPALKMLGLLIIAVAFVIYLLKFMNIGTETLIPILKQYITIPMLIYVPFAIIVMLGTTNAVNLTDGIDGLATSITTIIIACLTVIGLVQEIKEIVILGSIICGVNLGFLLFNMHPAKVFMGDTGSLLLGGAIASMALYSKMPLILLVIALIPVIETISVIMQVAYFKKTGKRIFKMTPIHHHFELSGWNENKIVTVFSIATLLLCVIGLNII